MDKKLTFPQIVNLVACGKQDELPEGYKIKWFGNQEPGVLYDCVIPKENVILTGNNRPPIPDEVHINGEIQVQPYYGDEVEEPVEYGEVTLMTHLVPSEVKFYYKPGNNEITALVEYIRKNAESVIGRTLLKKDLVFDGEFHFENYVFILHAMFNIAAGFGPIVNDEPTDIILDFVYDYMSQEMVEE